MRKHGILFAGISAALAVMLCGCGSVDGVTNLNSQPANSGGLAGQTSDTANAPVMSNAGGENPEFPSKCKIYKQTTVKFTDEQLLDYFDRHPECGTPQKSEHYSEIYHRYEAESAIGYVNKGDNLYFSTDKGNFFENAVYFLEEYDGADKEKLYTDGDLDFASREEVLEKVRTELSERCGIDPDEWWAFEFKAVKKECLEKLKQQAYLEAYEPGEEVGDLGLEKERYYYEKIKDVPAEDFYYLDMRFKIDDIPLFMGGLLDVGGLGSGRGVTTSFFSLVYGKNGIESISISPAYETDRENAQEVELIPADQAWGLIQKKYDEIITANPPEILDMKLFYLPIPQNKLGEYGQEYELRPYYGFYGTQTEEYEGETYSYAFATYFDAVTGKELASTQGLDTADVEASDWGFEV